MLYLSTVVTIAPFRPEFDEGCQTLMMRCIQEVKQRNFDPEHDEDMSDLAQYYDPEEGSLLLVVLAPMLDEHRSKVIGTLGLKNLGMIDGQKTGMLRRLYVEPAQRAGALFPLLHAMRSHVIEQRFQALQFIARKRMGGIFETYKGIAKHLGMEHSALDEESILYTWNLPGQDTVAFPKLFSAVG
jgi:hypothetical protein